MGIANKESSLCHSECIFHPSKQFCVKHLINAFMALIAAYKC